MAGDRYTINIPGCGCIIPILAIIGFLYLVGAFK